MLHQPNVEHSYTENRRERVLSMLAAAKNVPDPKHTADGLEIARVAKWIDERCEEDVLKSQ